MTRTKLAGRRNHNNRKYLSRAASASGAASKAPSRIGNRNLEQKGQKNPSQNQEKSFPAKNVEGQTSWKGRQEKKVRCKTFCLSGK